MVTAGRRKSIAFVIALGIGLILVILLLYVGFVLLDWRHGILLFLGALLLLMILAGVVINTIFLVREIRRNEQHDAFINAVTHELKTPVASIRLYLQTLQTRSVDDSKRKEFYKIMLEDSDRLLSTIEQILRTGRMARRAPSAESFSRRHRRAGGTMRRAGPRRALHPRGRHHVQPRLSRSRSSPTRTRSAPPCRTSSTTPSSTPASRSVSVWK